MKEGVSKKKLILISLLIILLIIILDIQYTNILRIRNDEVLLSPEGGGLDVKVKVGMDGWRVGNVHVEMDIRQLVADVFGLPTKTESGRTLPPIIRPEDQEFPGPKTPKEAGFSSDEILEPGSYVECNIGGKTPGVKETKEELQELWKEYVSSQPDANKDSTIFKKKIAEAAKVFVSLVAAGCASDTKSCQATDPESKCVLIAVKDGEYFKPDCACTNGEVKENAPKDDYSGKTLENPIGEGEGPMFPGDIQCFNEANRISNEKKISHEEACKFCSSCTEGGKEGVCKYAPRINMCVCFIDGKEPLPPRTEEKQGTTYFPVGGGEKTPETVISGEVTGNTCPKIPSANNEQSRCEITDNVGSTKCPADNYGELQPVIKSYLGVYSYGTEGSEVNCGTNMICCI